ncbi:hypothetical protein SAMN04490205_4165 [Pseudomonas trivialis]|uniref:Transposase n=1 Tax=Pseudomonas trivialis TaxID=200450 RepID=A0ABY0UN70_9PSED|nr:hypothetical protein SAMN04490205_4165 [Pseudomonas trivialis]
MSFVTYFVQREKKSDSAITKKATPLQFRDALS